MVTDHLDWIPILAALEPEAPLLMYTTTAQRQATRVVVRATV